MSIASCGVDGKDGKDGETPTIEISSDGYWIINGEKTDVRATYEEVVDENPQGLGFFIQDDGTYVVGAGYAQYLSNIVIPETYKGAEIVRITREGFMYCDALENITIPDSVTSIGDYAFAMCTSLTSISMPDSLVGIGEYAFYNCASLESITLPDSLVSIGEWAFGNCTSLTSITIPDSVTSIDRSVFLNCTLLKSINYEGTVEQWNAISKDSYWNSSLPATEVICTDGTVTLTQPK